MASPAYHVKQSEPIGRYIVSSRELSAGEEVLNETPFSVGPKENSYLVCLGCYTPLEAPSPRCGTCKWPICSAACSQTTCHKEYECDVFSKAGIIFQDDSDESAQLSCIAPLRTLLASEREPARWKEEVEGMEAHTAERCSDLPKWQAEQVNVVQFLRQQCKLERFSEDLIHEVCGILEVNCFEVVTRLSTTIRGLYPKSGLLSHSCIVNTTHSIDPDNGYRLQLRTTVAVGAGKHLFGSYTSSLHPTLVRRARLRQHKYFSCSCQRCSDPTELGSHVGTLKCTKCDNGVITSTSPLDDEAAWKCSHCDNGVTGQGVRRVYEAIQTEIEQLESLVDTDRLEATEKVLRGYKSVLHPRNGFNVMLWHSLSQMYGHTDGYTLDMLPDILLERKAQFCKSLLEVLNIIEPGYTRIRGMTLYELHVSLLMIARSQYQREEISAEKLKQSGKEVIELLKECTTILSLEPPSSPEAYLAAIAQQSIVQLEQSLKEL